jgi:hypothetical protein
MPSAINDDLAGRWEYSRQQKYQMRKERLKRCRICGRPASKNGRLCVDHEIQAIQLRRRKP